jgi:hypothetical protein
MMISVLRTAATTGRMLYCCRPRMKKMERFISKRKRRNESRMVSNHSSTPI